MYYDDYYIKAGIRMHPNYERWKRAVLRRDDFTCRDCGTRPFMGLRTIFVHHIKKFNDIIYENQIENIPQALECKELWDINNGKTLCRPCHEKYRGRH